MENRALTGNVFDIQHFSISDGPGIRTTVFLKGCPLRCIWCHNPESYSISSQIIFHKDKCVYCGKCVAACPSNCHTISGNVHSFDSSLCTNCHKCEKVCAFGALQNVGRKMTVDEVMEEVLEDIFFYESTGGVTLSGGEPMYQSEFATLIAKKAKENGISVCIETSGFCSEEALKKIMPYTDIFLFDYKATGEKHKEYTGVDNAVILQNLFMLDGNGAKIILRCPMIPDKNIDSEHIDGIINTAKKLKNLVEINLEPYHSIGNAKRQSLGILKGFLDIESVSKNQLSEAAKKIQSETQVKTIVL